jgi:hypothetical protein
VPDRAASTLRPCCREPFPDESSGLARANSLGACDRLANHHFGFGGIAPALHLPTFSAVNPYSARKMLHLLQRNARQVGVVGHMCVAFGVRRNAPAPTLKRRYCRSCEERQVALTPAAAGRSAEQPRLIRLAAAPRSPPRSIGLPPPVPQHGSGPSGMVDPAPMHGPATSSLHPHGFLRERYLRHRSSCATSFYRSPSMACSRAWGGSGSGRAWPMPTVLAPPFVVIVLLAGLRDFAINL